jgi:hypothetical protein
MKPSEPSTRIGSAAPPAQPTDSQIDLFIAGLKFQKLAAYVVPNLKHKFGLTSEEAVAKWNEHQGRVAAPPAPTENNMTLSNVPDGFVLDGKSSCYTVPAALPAPTSTSVSGTVDQDGMLERCPWCHGYHAGECHKKPTVAAPPAQPAATLEQEWKDYRQTEWYGADGEAIDRLVIDFIKGKLAASQERTPAAQTCKCGQKSNGHDGLCSTCRIKNLTERTPSLSITELATMQNVKPMVNPSILIGGFPEDEDIDEFLSSIREERTPSDTPPAPSDSERKTMPDDCGRCGAPRESTIHMTTHPNAEIRIGAHEFEPDDYVAWLCFKRDATISVCDSDTPNAFRVYRQRPTPTMKSRDDYQSCPKCAARWLANETLPCPSCSGVAAEGSHPRIETEQEEDGRWVAEIPDRPGVMAYGKTEEEAIANTSALLAEGSQPSTPDYKALCGQLLTALETYVEHYGDEFKIARTAIGAAKEAGIS